MDNKEGYKTKVKQLTGVRWVEVYKKALVYYKGITNKTKRKPYVRSAYFNKQKIFLELFWRHLFEKQNLRDKTRRLKLLPCAIDLIENAHVRPESKGHPYENRSIVHRFIGVSGEGNKFKVQIKENKKTGMKWLISVYPFK